MRDIPLKIVLIIFLISFIPRVILLAAVVKINHGDVTMLVGGNDGYRYCQEAALLSGKSDYSRAHLADTKLREYGIWWDVPFYPMFLSTFFKLFQPSYLLAIFLNIILFSLSVPIFYAIGVTLLGETGGICATIIYSFYPTLILNSLPPMAEPLFLVLFLSAFLCFILFLKSPEIKYLILTAILLGLSAMTKEVVLPFILVPAIVLILENGKRWKRALKSVLVLSIIYAAIISPIVIYNYNNSGRFVVSGKMAAYEDCLKKYKQVYTFCGKKSPLPKINALSIFSLDYFYKRKHFFCSTGTTDLMRLAGCDTSGLQKVTNDPKSFLIALKKSGLGWMAYQLGTLFFITCVYLSGFCGLLLLIIRRRFKEAAAFLLILFYFLIAYFHNDYSRYFIPVIPFLSILSAYFLANFPHLRKS